MKKIYMNQFNKYWNPLRLITNEEYELNVHTIIWFWILMRGQGKQKTKHNKA
jgi:hypothetical protein